MKTLYEEEDAFFLVTKAPEGFRKSSTYSGVLEIPTKEVKHHIPITAPAMANIYTEVIRYEFG